MTQTKPTAKDLNDWLQKGILLVLIGLAVLLSPHFIKAPELQTIVANSALVGWFSLVLGAAFLVRYVRRRGAQS